MASHYPPIMYHFPIQLLERLPIQVRGLPLDSLLQVHCVLALLASPFTITPHYSLPLALALLISTSLSAHLFPHFLLLWLLSIPLDLMWLTYKASLARDVVVTLVGIGMILKVVSAGLVAEKCVDEGVVSGGSTGGSGGAQWASAGVSGGLSIPGGFWSGSGGGRGHDGGYSAIYDDEEAIVASDAQQVHIGGAGGSVPGQPKGSN